MEIKEINNHVELELCIIKLKEEKLRQEDELKQKIKNFANNLDPLVLVKDALHKMAENKEIQFDAMKVAFNYGSNYLIEKIFGKNTGFKAYITEVLTGKIIATLVDKYLPELLSSISNLLRKSHKQDEERG
jgi:hypothetical protein